MVNILSGNKNNPGGKTSEASAVEPTIIRPAGPKPNFEVRVGFFATLAAILLLYGWGWLKGLSIFHPPQRFTVAFHDVEGLNTNAPVNTNGVRVGIVEKIELKKNQVLVHLKINTEDVRIPEKSRFTIQTLGLVGAKYLEIMIPQEALNDATSDNVQVSTHMLTEADPPQPGDDPVRMEVYLSKLGRQIGDIDLKKIVSKIDRDMDQVNDMASAAKNTFTVYGQSAPDFNRVAKSLDKVATKADGAVGSANKFFEKGSNSLGHFSTLADDWDTTAHRANKILANPNLTVDLKATAEQARIASESIQKAIHELNGTIGDQQIRTDIEGIMRRMQASTENIAHSIATVNKVADDKGLRSDIKEIVTKANSAIDKVNGVVNQPQFGADLVKTMSTVRSAASDVDTAAKQINATISQPHFLWHQINPFSRKVTVKKKVKTDKNGNQEVTTKETTKVPGAAATKETSKESTRVDAAEPTSTDEPARTLKGPLDSGTNGQ